MRYFPRFIKQYSSLLTLLIFLLAPIPASAKLVIAQGGGSGYLMEHSLPSVALAVAMDADIIKIDVALTADNEVIVLGSTTLGKETNIAEIFPSRSREDGKFYALDLTLQEIRQLTLHDREGRFPEEFTLHLGIPTLKEELALISTFDKHLGKNSRIAVELKKPWLHRKEGKDLSKPLLGILQEYGYSGSADDIYLLSYDAVELRHIRKELLPEMGMTVKLVQLIESNEGQETMIEEWGEWVSYNYDWMFSKSGLRALSASVAAIALPKHLLADSQGKPLLADFVETSHQLNTMIFTFPVQKEETGRLPFAESFDEELEFFYYTVGVDGIITDFCKDALEYLENRVEKPGNPIEPPLIIPPSSETPINDPLQLTSPAELELKE